MTVLQRPFYTVGHSTRSVAELVGLLQQVEARLIVDVRSIPRSRTSPQFNAEVLPTSLAAWQIGYRHIQALGGLRGRQKDRGPSPNTFWENLSFRNYADYAGTDAFRAGLTELRQLGHERTCAIMCAEAVWWRCHRRIIADYLLSVEEPVFHIMGLNRVVTAVLTPSAVRRPDDTLVYPAAQVSEREAASQIG